MRKWRVMVMSIVATAVVVAAEPQIPCLFLFGDSMLDNGNNIDKLSIATANFRPYGIDFPEGPTGRFSNGETIADVISNMLGFDEYIPSYRSARGQQILKGVNYASAAAGIRPETGRTWGGRIYFEDQVNNFKRTAAEITNILGHQSSAANHLGKCIYILELGNNDFVNNYFLPQFYTTSQLYSIPEFITLLIQQYSDQIRVLYEVGARKMALIGNGPSGCIPLVLSLHSVDGSTCVENYNQASVMFNKKLRTLVDDFNTEFPSAQFIYVDGYYAPLHVINNPLVYGLKVSNAACCGRGKNNATFICLPGDTPCEKREEYVFWDFAHATEAANKVFAKRVYKAQSPSDAYPFDLYHLAQFHLNSTLPN